MEYVYIHYVFFNHDICHVYHVEYFGNICNHGNKKQRTHNELRLQLAIYHVLIDPWFHTELDKGIGHVNCPGP